MKKNKIIAVCFVLVGMAFLVIPFTRAIFKSLGGTTKTVTTAAWSVSLNQTGLSDSVSIVSGVDTQTYTLKVRSNSEVDVVYDIEIENVPAGVKIKLDQRLDYETPDSNNKITFTDAGTLSYSSQGGENTHILTFASDVGTAAVSNRQLTVNVIAQQDI